MENQSLYCKFVEAFCRFRDDGSNHAVVVRKAQEEWNSLRDDERAVRRRIEKLESVPTEDSTPKMTWKVTVTSGSEPPEKMSCLDSAEPSSASKQR